MAAVEDHHDKHANQHDTVHDRPDHAGGKGGTQNIQRAETGLNIPEFAPLKIAERQPQQMGE